MQVFSTFFGLYSLSALALHFFELNLGLGGGGMKRMIVFPLIIWLAAYSGYLLHPSPRKLFQTKMEAVGDKSS